MGAASLITAREAMAPALALLPGKPHGQRSLVGYRPWGHKESDMTEQLTHTHTLNNKLTILWVL